MTPESYIDSIKITLATSSIVRCIDMLQERTHDLSGFIRIRLRLINDDFMELVEFFKVIDDQVETVEYRYQWMNPEKTILRKRWDNAPHHPELPNFPHHVHTGNNGRILAGQVIGIVSFIDMLEESLNDHRYSSGL